MRVGTTDYEVYPCTWDANAGYYVPWEGSASGQFWISDPRWEWGGDGGALCADSDGDWRDNGVREGDPNPDWGDEYRRAQTAWNNAQDAFSDSVARLAQRRAEIAQAAALQRAEAYEAAVDACGPDADVDGECITAAVAAHTQAADDCMAQKRAEADNLIDRQAFVTNRLLELETFNRQGQLIVIDPLLFRLFTLEFDALADRIELAEQQGYGEVPCHS